MKKRSTIFSQISGKAQVLPVFALLSLSFFFSCVDNDDVPETMYTAKKMTAGAFLEAHQDRYSDFTTLLKRTPYFSMMTTYGRYTLFAPTNDAMADFVKSNGYGSIEAIPQGICDTIARTHIMRKGAVFTSDIPDGDIGTNMLDAYLGWTSDSDVVNDNRLIYYVNKNSRMLEYNDSVTNGVVHTLDHVISASNDFLPEKMAEDSTITLFCEALRLTHMDDSLHNYMDNDYSIGTDSVYNGTSERCLNNGNPRMTCLWVDTRYFKYTAFVEPDSIYHRNGIHTIDDLKEYAKKIYDATYPEDAGLYDNDPTHRKNPLNRFVSYHLLDRYALYNQLVGNDLTKDCWKTTLADPEDFYETMCPGTLMRLAMPSGDQQGIYINRRGLMSRLYDSESRGVKVLSPSESGKTNQQDALNGYYHYLDDILTFNVHTRDVIFNCRMRFDPATLSPDFMNCDGRNHKTQEGNYIRGFKKGFIKGWEMSDESFVGVTGNDIWWASFLGHVVVISGRFDVTFKLPPVPKRGTYEIRIGYTPNEERGVIQAYLNNVPCGIPVDMRIYPTDPEIGFIADGAEGAQTEEEIKMQDKALHNRGFLKGPDVWYQGGTSTTNALRALNLPTRRVLATESMDPEKAYYLRLRQVLDDPEKYCNFNYLELCPKSVYASPEGEDQH